MLENQSEFLELEFILKFVKTVRLLTMYLTSIAFDISKCAVIPTAVYIISPSQRNFLKSFTSNFMNNRTVGLESNDFGLREFSVCLITFSVLKINSCHFQIHLKFSLALGYIELITSIK